MRGTWLIETEYKGNHYLEKLQISHQNEHYFKGLLISPHPTRQGYEIAQDFCGEFVDKYTAFYTYQESTKGFTEMGSGVFKISMDHGTIIGKSVNLGISADEPTVAAFKGIRK